MRLTLVTINVWSGLNYQGYLRAGSLEPAGSFEARYRVLVDGLRQLDPDVVALNEANPIPRYVDRLARDLGYQAVSYPGLSGLRLGPLALPVNLIEGDALLARPALDLRWVGRTQVSGWPVGRHASFNFGNATQVIAASVRVSGRRLYLLNCHWSVCNNAQDYLHQQGYLQDTVATPAANQAHARAARRRWLESTRTLTAARRWVPPGAPAVLMGDLNTHPDAPEIELWRSAGWTDAFRRLHPGRPGHTWDEAANGCIREHYHQADAQAGERLDYILTNQVATGGLLTAEVVLDSPPHPSDHYGVAVTLEL